MSTKKYAFVTFIFDELVIHWNLRGYKDLSDYLGVKYQTLMAWKKRDSIGDLAPFMDKGISKKWLETGHGEMVEQVPLNTVDEFYLRLKKRPELYRAVRDLVNEYEEASDTKKVGALRSVAETTDELRENEGEKGKSR